MKIVLDTMLWVSYCTLKDGYRHRSISFDKVLREDLDLSTRYSRSARRAVLRVAKVAKLPPSSRAFVPGDPNDDPIVLTALTAKAGFLVTVDKEILKVGKVHDVDIITPKELELLIDW